MPRPITPTFNFVDVLTESVDNCVPIVLFLGRCHQFFGAAPNRPVAAVSASTASASLASIPGVGRADVHAPARPGFAHNQVLLHGLERLPQPDGGRDWDLRDRAIGPVVERRVLRLWS
jgi:hypothetical protein